MLLKLCNRTALMPRIPALSAAKSTTSGVFQLVHNKKNKKKTRLGLAALGILTLIRAIE